MQKKKGNEAKILFVFLLRNTNFWIDNISVGKGRIRYVEPWKCLSFTPGTCPLKTLLKEVNKINS